MHQNSEHYALQLMKAFHQGDNTSTQIFVTKLKKIFPFPDFVQWWQMESPENITGVWWSKWTSVLQRMDRQSSRAKQESTALWYTAITKILLKYIVRIQYKWFFMRMLLTGTNVPSTKVFRLQIFLLRCVYFMNSSWRLLLCLHSPLTIGHCEEKSTIKSLKINIKQWHKRIIMENELTSVWL